MLKMKDNKPVFVVSGSTLIVLLAIFVLIVALSIVVVALPSDAEAATILKTGYAGFQVDPHDTGTRIDLFCIEGLLIARSKPEGYDSGGYASGHLLNLGLQDLCK